MRGDRLRVDPDSGEVEAPPLKCRSATLVRAFHVEAGVRVLRAASPDWPDIVLDHDNETMIRGVVVFAGRGI